MKAIDLACRHTDPDGTNCMAQEGELCNKTSAYGQRYASSVPHQERVLDAADFGVSNADPKLVDEAFEAVMDRLA